MKVTIIGCSPAWPNAGGAQSGYLVEGAEAVLLDCGAGVLARLREREPWPCVSAIVLTHLHLDHWADIVPWAFGATFGPGRSSARTELCVPEESRDALLDLARALSVADAISTAFEIRGYEAENPFSVAGFEVVAHRVLHYEQAAFALRVREADRVLAYSADSGPCEGLVAAARGADLFLCEATLAEDADEGVLRGHLSASEALAASTEAGARRTALIHRPSELPTPPGVERARDGDTFEV